MTPEQKELKIEAYRAWLDDCGVALERAKLGSPKHWKPIVDPTGEVFADACHVRLAPPAEIPWHNPEGVTQEQLEPEKGYRFLLADEVLDNSISSAEWTHNSWSDEYCGSNNERYTYRTREPLPEKYQHLVPESEEARARRLLLEVPQKEGYGPWEFEGCGLVREPAENEILAAYVIDGDQKWRPSPMVKGWKRENFYARARKLPTEKEKAEAALNAYKLEPGERLEWRGYRWNSGRRKCSFLYVEIGKPVSRHDKHDASAGPGYYAEIIKEPELVPFTQETWPVGAILKSFQGFIYKPVAVTSKGVWRVDINQLSPVCETWEILLDHEWMMTLDNGTTWTRAGKGVGA